VFSHIHDAPAASIHYDRPVRRSRLILFVAVVLVGSIVTGWMLERRSRRAPYAVPPQLLTSWALVRSDGTDPWVVGARPPEALVSQLSAEITSRAGTALKPPPHIALPLVLRSEFDDALQGVYGEGEVLRIARDAGVDTAVYEPLCIGHRTRRDDTGTADLYFVAFDSPAFNQMRIDLTPIESVHAGIGEYDPSLLTPILVIGATDDQFDRWWPLRFDRARDCQADLKASSQ
jgi:hypothetical protein